MSSPLIEPAELAALAGMGAVDDLVIADVRWRLNGPPGRGEFEAGHLPRAHYVDLETELSGPPGAGGRHPLPSTDVVQAVLRRIGVRNNSLVVVYDGATSLAASRLWWLLTDAGHARTRVLDGGLAAWRQAGLPIVTGPSITGEPGDVVLRPGLRARVGAEELWAAAAAGRAIVDVRAADRYAGQNETVDPVAGHIPGARNLPSADNLTPEGRFRPPEAIADRFAGVDDPLLYCGSGITATQTLLALEVSGRSGVIYPGSWSDWITDPLRPIATGSAP